MRKTMILLAVMSVLAAGCTKRSEPAPDRFEFMSPEGRKLAEDFERDRLALKSDLDRMNAEMDALLPALDEVTAQLMAENDRLVNKLGREAR